MNHARNSSPRGSVALLTLCIVAVLAISLGSFITLSYRAMQQSNRAVQSNLALHTAETGAELALYAYSRSDWSNWTAQGGGALSAGDAVAVRIWTPTNAEFPVSGAVTTANLLVTNRNVSVWTGAAANSGHLAWYRGQWYQAKSNVSASIVPPPDDTTKWTSAPAAWSSSTTYNAGDIVIYNGTVYRCTSSHIGKTPPDTNCWTTSTTNSWSSSTTYSVNDTVLINGTVYKCIAAHSGQQPPHVSYWAGAPVIYAQGKSQQVDAASTTTRVQLRAEISPVSLFPNAVGATNNSSPSINISSSGTIESYNADAATQLPRWSAYSSYAQGDTVYYPVTGLVYRCILPHANREPTNPSYWTLQVSGYRPWSSAENYTAGDIVVSAGKLYRCNQSHTNQTPPNATYWDEQMTFVPWNSSTSYALGALVANASGKIYRSILTPNSNRALTNTTYWDVYSLTTWSSATAFAVGDRVIGTNGSVYRCTTAHTNQILTNTAYWTVDTTSIANLTTWNSATAYAVDDLICYQGSYYRCISAHTNQEPVVSTVINSTYWAPDLVGIHPWISGVAYAVGNVVCYQPPSVGGRDSGAVLYRCIQAHTSSGGTTPTDTGRWAMGAVGVSNWMANMSYSVGDIVSYNPAAFSSTSTIPFTGFFYRCKTAHTASSAVTPASATSVGSNWEHTNTSFASWSGSTAYKVGDLVYNSSNSTVYRCITDHTNQTPPNSSYWSTSLGGHSAVVSAPYVTSSSTATIKGYANATSTTFGTSTYVQGPTSASSPKVDPARVSNNPYVPRLDAPDAYSDLSGVGSNLPSTEGNGTYLYEGARTLGTPGATTPSVYNITRTYDGSSGTSTTSGLYLDDSTDVLTIVGPVVLNISGTLNTSSGRIVIAPTGSLEIYFTGSLYIGSNSSTTISSFATPTGGGIINQTFDPKKLLIVGSSTANSSGNHYLWTRFPFYGLIYMPDAYLHLWNSGYNGERYGAFSARTVYFNHPANLDYDISLRTAGAIGTYIDRGYQITTLRELIDSSEQVAF
ncbi:MAG: hypothetical protein C0502_05435 [Opitutus sp.]|nr:hypothetical protein [Opitutus sp.]